MYFCLQQLSKSIMDNVHGAILTPAPLDAVMDTWPVQRLRNIHQLGVTVKVYPSANHTRFEHSLG